MPEASILLFRAPDTAPRPLVRFERVAYCRGGDTLLDDVSFSLSGPGKTVFLGPNGAGKSLMLRLAAGLILPDQGVVTRTVPLNRIALMPQRPVLLRRSVMGNLDHALRLARLSRRERRERKEKLLAISRLEALARRPARALSGGEAQRLALIRALAGGPRVLLLDEPGTGLDPGSSAALERLIDEAVSEGVKVAFVTHDLGQARRLADEVIFVARGQVRQHAPAVHFFDRPGHPAARAYLEGRLDEAAS